MAFLPSRVIVRRGKSRCTRVREPEEATVILYLCVYRAFFVSFIVAATAFFGCARFFFLVASSSSSCSVLLLGERMRALLCVIYLDEGALFCHREREMHTAKFAENISVFVVNRGWNCADCCSNVMRIYGCEDEYRCNKRGCTFMRILLYYFYM